MRPDTTFVLRRSVPGVGVRPTHQRLVEGSSVTAAADARLVPSEGKERRREVQENSMTNPPALSAKWSVAADPSQVRIVRREAAAQVDKWGLPDLVDPVRLLLTELLTNAIEHTNGTRVDTRLSHNEGILEIEVSDLGDGQARLKRPDEEQENGRGLMIVDTLALAWGTRPRSGNKGKSTWCTLEAEQANSALSAQRPASASSHHGRKSEPPPRVALSLARWLNHGAQRLRSSVSGPANFPGVATMFSDATAKVVTAA